VVARLRKVEPEEIHASVITLFELRFGSMLRDDATNFWQKIETDIFPLVRWLDVDRSVASKAGDIAANLQRLGTPIGVNDCLIGGTALVHNLILVSRNVRHFEKITNLLREVW